eukprot:3876490-Rhodomonas_salina.11
MRRAGSEISAEQERARGRASTRATGREEKEKETRATCGSGGRGCERTASAQRRGVTPLVSAHPSALRCPVLTLTWLLPGSSDGEWKQGAFSVW